MSGLGSGKVNRLRNGEEGRRSEDLSAWLIRQKTEKKPNGRERYRGVGVQSSETGEVNGRTRALDCDIRYFLRALLLFRFLIIKMGENA